MIIVGRVEAWNEVHILLSTAYALSVSFLQQVSTEALLRNLLVRKEAAWARELLQDPYRWDMLWLEAASECITKWKAGCGFWKWRQNSSPRFLSNHVYRDFTHPDVDVCVVGWEVRDRDFYFGHVRSEVTQVQSDAHRVCWG